MEKYSVFAARSVSQEELIASGHRACQGCAEILAVRLVLKALGKDTIIAMATGCMEIVSSPLPITSWRIPWIHNAFENPAAVITGCEAGMKALMRKGKLPKKKINFVGIGGDGATADIGIGPLSGAMERGHDFIYVCLDNEAYMNTGIQRSSLTPYGASTTTSPAGKKSIGQQTKKKNMPQIAAAHNIPYVATACPSFPFDLMEKLKRASEIQGPAYIHILSVCPTGWRIPSEDAIKYGRLAVDTGVFPLYEVIYGEYRLNYKPEKLLPVKEYLEGQGRFRHLTEKDIEEIQEMINADYQYIVKRSEGRFHEYEKTEIINNKVLPAGLCDESKTYFIDREKCTGCMLCAKNCPRQCISGERKMPHTIDEARCVRCGVCFDVCKFDAIRVKSSK